MACSARVAASLVFRGRHWLNVIGIATRAHLAQVVTNKSVFYFPNVQFIDKPMGKPHALLAILTNARSAISVLVSASSPKPTTAVRFKLYALR
jgi:hypothetical protein